MVRQVKPGFLLLSDGKIFTGELFGFESAAGGEGRFLAVGEICFNTSLSGYQEIITDPSYYNQIVTFTTPMIGNYGVNPTDMESERVWLSAIICREYVDRYSNYQANQSLGEFLATQKKPILSGVDTRELTLYIREQGAQNAIICQGSPEDGELIKAARVELERFPGLVGRNLAGEVAAPQAYSIEERLPLEKQADQEILPRDRQYKVAVIDCGVKYNILRNLRKYGFEVRVFPVGTPVAEMEDWGAQSYFISNGPGDPEPVEPARNILKEIIEKGTPLFGICLGHQLISLAGGAATYKMKFGHRGGNQPVMDEPDNRVQITSQNHGFAVFSGQEKSQVALSDKNRLAAHSNVESPYRQTQINLNDGTMEGLRFQDKPVLSVQYHPEAAPGPRDASVLFERFYQMVDSFYQTGAGA